MKTIKIIIIFCLACSTAILIFASWAIECWQKTQQDSLALSFESAKAKNIQQEFIAADQNGKIKIFSDFLRHIQDRDISISASIGSSHQMMKWAAGFVYIFNFLIAVCVVYLLYNRKDLASNGISK